MALFFVYLSAQTYLYMHILDKLILFVVVLAVAGCSGGYHKDFEKAESLMQDYPEDALAVLDSMKRYPIKGKAANARFALLYSQALDKNYIDVTDDSLISVAEAWYTRNGNVREKYLSHYYKGVVNSNAKNYPQAITAFSQAQKYEEELGDNYLLGQLYNQMGYIYESHYDYKKSLEAFVKAHDYYGQAGKPDHKNYMLMNIAGCYWNMAENTRDSIVYKKSEFYYREALKEGENTGYDILIKLASQYLFIQYIEREMYNKAEEILSKGCIYENTQNVVLMAAFAKYYCHKDNIVKAENIMEQAWKECKGINDTAKLYQWQYSINKALGHTGMALRALELSINIQNKAVSINLRQPVLNVQKRLLEKDLEYSQYKMEANRKIMVLVLLLSILLGCIAFYHVKGRINKKNERINDYINLVAELQCTLQNLQEKLQLKDSQLSSVYAKAYGTIKNRLGIVNKLSVIFYEKHGTPKEKQAFVREVENIIDGFRNNKEDIEWMEQMINSSNDNLLENIYKNYPSLKESEKKLLCYIYAGLSFKAISTILNIPLITVYNRKSRLLAKIGHSQEQECEKASKKQHHRKL